MAKKYPRIKRIVNQAEIARKAHITPQYVGMLLSGKRKSQKRIEQIRKIIFRELNSLLTTDQAM